MTGAWCPAAKAPQDICKQLGGRTDRGFAGRPGNPYAEVGASERLIYILAVSIIISIVRHLLVVSASHWVYK
jgi:hypothetical protein